MPRGGQAKTRRQNARRFALAEIAWRPHAARNQVAIDLNRPSTWATQQQIGEFESRSTHSAHFYGRFGASYFVTSCCHRRGINQFRVKDVASILFKTARRYHTSRRRYLKLLLLMPDHLHMLIGVPGDGQLYREAGNKHQLSNAGKMRPALTHSAAWNKLPTLETWARRN